MLWESQQQNLIPSIIAILEARLRPESSAGVANYTVAQGDTLNVNFNTNSSSVVIMGGSKSGGFAEDAPCQLTGHLGPAASQPVAANTITGFTFSPTRAVCPSVNLYFNKRGQFLTLTLLFPCKKLIFGALNPDVSIFT